MDGNISLPLVGVIPVAGLPLSQIRAQIRVAPASKVFRQRDLPDGREVVIVIDADEVTTVVGGNTGRYYVNGGRVEAG